MFKWVFFGLLAPSLALALPATAQAPIKVGVIGQFSGPFAVSGAQFRQGIGAYIALHGTKAGGRQVELIYRDEGGPNPAVTKRLAQELIVNDKVSILTGFYLSSEASAVASVVTETKTPTMLFVPAAGPIIKQSPYFIRVGNTIWQDCFSTADWAVKSHKMTAYVAVADFSAGYDVQRAFEHRYRKLGGKVVGEDRMPLNTVDYSPFAERIAQAKAGMVELFEPTGAPAVSFLKALVARGLLGLGKMAIGFGEANNSVLNLYDDSVIGFYSTNYYAVGLPNAENRRFKTAVEAKLGTAAVPEIFATVDAYDGMHLIYRMIEAQAGKPFDGTVAINAVRGYAWTSPRGPVQIDAKTRNIIENEYIRRVEKVNGHLENVVVDTFKAVKDPWSELNP